MTVEEAIAAFSGMSSDEQIWFLVGYGYWLTIEARGAYADGIDAPPDAAFLGKINEIQHRVFGHLSHLLDSDGERYPDDVLVKIIVAEDSARLLRLFEKTLDDCAANPRMQTDAAVKGDGSDEGE
jgi:hypothetical protein